MNTKGNKSRLKSKLFYDSMHFTNRGQKIVRTKNVIAFTFHLVHISLNFLGVKFYDLIIQGH